MPRPSRSGGFLLAADAKVGHGIRSAATARKNTESRSVLKKKSAPKHRRVASSKKGIPPHSRWGGEKGRPPGRKWQREEKGKGEFPHQFVEIRKEKTKEVARVRLDGSKPVVKKKSGDRIEEGNMRALNKYEGGKESRERFT